MTTISVRDNFPAIAARLDALPEKIGRQAMARALNKSIDQGKTEMARTISKEFRITVGKAKERLLVSKASTRVGQVGFHAVLSASDRSHGRSMNLIAFVIGGKVSKAKAKKMVRADRAGQIQLQIKRGGGRKVIPGAFIANKGRTVFIREGKGRLPIKSLSTIDIPQMFNTKRINFAVRAAILKRLQANFNRELRVVLEGWAR